MRAYAAVFKMRLIAGLQYRAAAWAGIATQFFFGFMYIMIYLAFYRGSTTPPPMEFSQLATYLWLQQAFYSAVELTYQDNELLGQIAGGDISYELCRPYELYSYWYARLLAQRVSYAVMKCAPILLVASFLPAPYRLSLPAGAAAAALFLLSLGIAILLVAAISMFVYILTFVTLSPLGARLVIGVAAEFLMGSILPIPLMPDFLQRVLDFLPFRYIADLPFRVYSGNIAGGDAVRQIGIQIAWLIGLAFLGSLAFKRITRRIVIQGG
jgi:ABC-2 type transport system permease protein